MSARRCAALSRRLCLNPTPRAGRRTVLPPDPTVIDRARWEELALLGDGQLLAQILASFIEEAPGRLATLRRAVEENDASAAEAAAHTMKGSAATIGVGGVARLMAVVEARGREGNLEGLASTIDAIEAEMEHAVDALRAALP